MAVYTPVSRADLNGFVLAYDLGELLSFTGVEQGVENTNYIVETARGRFVLTLFEKRAKESDLPFFAAAMGHFSAHGVPAPAPVADRAGRFYSSLNARPAALFTFLSGRQRMAPSGEDCRMMGALNARLHRSAEGFALTRQNPLSLDGWRALADACRARADEAGPSLGALIDDELRFLEGNWPRGLTTGLVHADLFPDNVFFDDAGVSGVIDFYFACTDLFVYDLAITLNAWAAAAGVWDGDRARALIAGYESIRALPERERTALGICLRAASLRILLTRLHDWLYRIDGAVVAVKDPLEYRDLLLFHRHGGSVGLFGKSHD